MDMDPALVVDALGELSLLEFKPAIYDWPIGIRLLLQDRSSGAEHYVIRYPGLNALPRRHTEAHTIIVLDGQLVANGQAVGPGSYCHFSGRSPHAPCAR